MNSNQTATATIIDNGFYTLVYPNGEHRTLRVKTPTTGNFKDKKIVGFLSGSDNTRNYTNFAFLTENGELKIWRNFANANSPERLARIRKAIMRLAETAPEAGKAYALNSGNCYVCGKLLTEPVSIGFGIGPTCRRARN